MPDPSGRSVRRHNVLIVGVRRSLRKKQRRKGRVSMTGNGKAEKSGGEAAFSLSFRGARLRFCVRRSRFRGRHPGMAGTFVFRRIWLYLSPTNRLATVSRLRPTALSFFTEYMYICPPNRLAAEVRRADVPESLRRPLAERQKEQARGGGRRGRGPEDGGRPVR